LFSIIDPLPAGLPELGRAIVSREKNFNFGCVIRFTLQCSSSRLSETSGQYESEITIALLRRNTAISSSGFGSARTKTTTTS
jgi:hypothetical protein